MTTPPNDLRAALRTALTRAMRDRDRLAAAALRSGLGAIDNAEAVPDAPATCLPDGSHVAGAVVGLGATEAARRDLSADDVRGIVQAEVDDRRAAADEIERAGRPDRAADLRREADVLDEVLRA